jgi:geranylgeranyl pyrophosphate synthase
VKIPVEISEPVYNTEFTSKSQRRTFGITMAQNVKTGPDLEEKAQYINKILADLLDSAADQHPYLAKAMRYSLEAPGKRLRAVLVLLCSELVCGKAGRDAEIAAAAVEMVHTYSLIHDDLPAMDDDDFRRGRPSCHKQFDEATAILAGDALLTIAFEFLARNVTDAALAVGLISALAEAAGPAGMIAGQMADLEAEDGEPSPELLEYIHINKTAKMFRAACRMGALAGGAENRQLEALSDYGLKIGLGFQIVDDILDISETSQHLGKTAGKDAAQGKLTWPSLFGIEKSRVRLEQLAAEAVSALAVFDHRADTLRDLTQKLVRRTK